MTIKVDASPVSLTYPTNSHKDLESTYRLIALVPANIDFSAATQRIWGLAHTTGMQIQLLGLPNDTTEESRLRRELVTMASLLQDGKRCAGAKIETGTNWVEALKSNCQAGDMIVCFAEHETGILRKPLSQILESNLKATVYVLSDLTPQKSSVNKFSRISTWLGVIGIVVGFGLLQTRIVQLPSGWLQNTLLILSLIPEFWLIWIWDSQFR
jgi:hypothetical protein